MISAAFASRKRTYGRSLDGWPLGSNTQQAHWLTPSPVDDFFCMQKMRGVLLEAEHATLL